MTHTLGPKELQVRALREARTKKRPPAARPTQETLRAMVKAVDAKRKPRASAPAQPQAEPSAPPIQESTTMTKTTTKAKSKPKKSSKANARKAVKTKTAGAARAGSKVELIAGMLKSPDGCTAEEVRKACGWPSVSMNQQAKAAGLTLKKEKVDGVTRYRAA